MWGSLKGDGLIWGLVVVGGCNGGALRVTKEGAMLVISWPLALNLNGLIFFVFIFLMANLTSGFHKDIEALPQESGSRTKWSRHHVNTRLWLARRQKGNDHIISFYEATQTMHCNFRTNRCIFFLISWPFYFYNTFYYMQSRCA